MTLVRLAQYAVFGLVLGRAMDDDPAGTSPVEGTLLLVVGMLLLVSAARKIAKQPDEDAPPPRWMTMVDGILRAVGPSSWAPGSSRSAPSSGRSRSGRSARSRTPS